MKKVEKITKRSQGRIRAGHNRSKASIRMQFTIKRSWSFGEAGRFHWNSWTVRTGSNQTSHPMKKQQST